MTKKCAFCKLNEGKLTGEHIFPFGLISKFPEYEHAIFDMKKAVKLSPRKQVINDVCEKCNNEKLSALDNYGNQFILKYFSEKISPNQEVNIEYDYPILSKWVMKILYNSLRSDQSSYWLEDNSRYMIGEVPETTSKYNLFLGSYVYMAPMTGLFPDVPFQGLSNPVILKNSIEKIEYTNDNIEIIYVLRLMNAVFVLVCWKEDKWEPAEETNLAKILPHKLLHNDQSAAVIKRATDCFNSGHLYLLSSKSAQSVNDEYLNRLLGGLKIN